MRKIVVLFLVFIGLNSSSLSGADTLYYLNENFVGVDVPDGWKNEPLIVNKKWLISYGGQEEDANGDPINPKIPMPGSTSNIGIYFPQFINDTVKLITSVVELDGAVKPTLRFWHCQYPSFDGVDFLRLFFRPGPNSDWYYINAWTEDITSWTPEEIDISERGKTLYGDSSLFLTDTFQIAFEGIVASGRGVYLDSVSIKEDDVVDKYVKRITYNSIEYAAIPSGATNIPLEEVSIKIVGNTGDAILDSLTITPTGEGIGHLVENSFRLLTKSSDNTVAPTVLSTASLVDGEVIFTGINEYLKLGENSFVITASFKSDVEGQTNVQFKVPAYGINVSDTLLPTSDVLLSENHTIKEAIFYDDFESGSGAWSLAGDFEIGTPTGAVASGNNNPYLAFNGDNILATNLNGGYTSGIGSGTEYYAYTPELDLTYYINPTIYMQQFFNFYDLDSAVVDYSIDGGSNWTSIWRNSGAGTNISWTEYSNTSLNQVAKHQPQFQLRFGIAKTVTSYPGFSIDNFAILAEKLHTDVGITDVLQPYNDCLDCGNDTVKIWVQNFADGAAPDTIPVYFGLYGQDSTRVRDTIFGGIAKDDSILFTFSEQADFPKADFYSDFVIGIDLNGDQDPTNDTVTKPMTIQNNLTPITFEDFEYKGGMWLPNDGSSWASLDMSGTITTDPLSPIIWVLSPNGNYRNNDTSWVTSGCYNLKKTRNIVSFKYWSDSDSAKDGARFEYSIDDGLNWKILNDTLYGDAWGWHSDTVEVLASKGWSGTHEWTEVQALLPEEVDSLEKAKFRIFFMSDDTYAEPQGFAFNDLSIFPAPNDIGVSSILSPVDACQGANATTVDVRIMNYGYNKLDANDTIIVGVDFESDLPVTDTLILGADLVPGDSIDFTINTDIDITEADTFNITAYTLIEDDPFYYLSNNDTANYTFTVWKNPTILLADSILSDSPDTIVIKPVYPDSIAGYTFNWTPGNVTSSTYKISDYPYADTMYKVTVIEPNHLCVNTDSVNVLLLYFDAGVDTILSPLTNCELGDTVIQVRVRNNGTEVINSSKRIELFYQVDGGTIYKDTLTLTSDLSPGHTLLHNFSKNRYDFSVTKSYDIKAWGYYEGGGDEDSSNDSASISISHFGYTPLDLGADTVVQSLTYTLDAGSSFDTYLWSTGDETQTAFLDASLTDKFSDISGEYYVDAVDGNACPSSDTINVRFKIRDISPDFMVAPVDDCSRPGLEAVEVHFVNTGTDTIQITDSIIYTYQIDGGVVVSEKSPPSYRITPNAQYSYTFSVNEDFTDFRDYGFVITASAVGDLRQINDTIVDSVKTDVSPIVDLGDYPNPILTTPYILDAGAGPYNYLWQDNVSNNQTFSASLSGEYSVMVTDSVTGCAGYDTTNLVFDIIDYAITDISGLGTTECQGDYEDIVVSIANLGTESRFDISVDVGFIVDGAAPVIETVTIDGEWQKGSSNAEDVTLTSLMRFVNVGNNTLKVFSSHAADVVPTNDTLEQVVDIQEAPLVDFGGDTIHLPSGSLLDAGVHDTYIWQDLIWDDRYYPIYDAAYTYEVTVTDNDKTCITTKKVFVEKPSSIYSVGDNSANLDVNLYPNPTNEFIFIEANAFYGDYLDVEIYDLSNHLIWSDNYKGYGIYSHKLDVSSFAEGVYIIRFKNDKVSRTERFIKR